MTPKTPSLSNIVEGIDGSPTTYRVVHSTKVGVSESSGSSWQVANLNNWIRFFSWGGVHQGLYTFLENSRTNRADVDVILA